MATSGRHKIVLFKLSRVKCHCGWFYDQSAIAGIKESRLQDYLLDAFNNHVVNMSDRGKG